MKLGCTSAAYRAQLRDGTMSIEDWLVVCATDLDLDGVEFDIADLSAVDARALRNLKRRCTELHLTIAGVSVETDLCDGVTRQVTIERIKQSCDVAAYLGAPIVRVTAGSPQVKHANEPDGGRIVGLFRKVFGERQPDRRRLWSDVMWALRACADYAGERGVMVAVQNGGHTAIIDSAPALLQAVNDVGSPWLRACVSPVALPSSMGMDLAITPAIEVHALLRRVLDDGADAEFYWPEALRALSLGGYRGFVVLDLRDSRDAPVSMPVAARYMRGLLHLLRRQALLPEPEPEPANNGRTPHEAAEVVRRAAAAPKP